MTRVQVDAYRFGLRRMDAALVSRDPIPLHEELRGQRRAVVIGLVLAMIGLAGAAILGRLDLGAAGRDDQTAPASQSGAPRTVVGGPEPLVQRLAGDPDLPAYS